LDNSCTSDILVLPCNY